MDEDILNAADYTVLEKIRLQAYRDDLANMRAHRDARLAASTAHQAACLALQTASLDWQKAQFYSLPPELTPQQTLRLRLGEAIADKYFTTNSNTTQAGWDSDAALDAGKFGAALNAAVAEVLKP